MNKLSILSEYSLNVGLHRMIHGIPIGPFLMYQNYVTKWNDLMPLVEKYRLIIVPYKDDLWEAFSESGGFVIYNKKYLRAGAECLYLHLEEIAKSST